MSYLLKAEAFWNLTHELDNQSSVLDVQALERLSLTKIIDES